MGFLNGCLEMVGKDQTGCAWSLRLPAASAGIPALWVPSPLYELEKQGLLHGETPAAPIPLGSCKRLLWQHRKSGIGAGPPQNPPTPNQSPPPPTPLPMSAGLPTSHGDSLIIAVT